MLRSLLYTLLFVRAVRLYSTESLRLGWSSQQIARGGRPEIDRADNQARAGEKASAMGNCMGGSAKCANASTPFASKVIPGSSTSNSKAAQGSSSSSDRKKNATDEHAPAAGPPATASALKSFSTSDLRAATKNFGSSAYLGEGGFGCVYKGWIDEVTLAPAKPGATNAMMVAIKKLKKESYQGHREWLTEVTFLGELHHDNLVKLVGYCSDSDSNKLLVYEYMLRGSLENHLFRRGSGNQPPLPWATRVAVAADVARGLAFLHSRDVIFRDLKSSNVLLDTDHRAKLSDFGLARAGPTGGKTHVSTRVVGTRGYAAPEYVATGHLSAKSDVYGFGVVLLELMTGKRALDESRGLAAELLVDWARPMLVGDRRKVIRVMDTRLGGQYNKKQAQDVAALALRCLNNDGRSRPTMAEVLPCLEQLLKENTTKSSSAAAARSATPVHRDHRRHTG